MRCIIDILYGTKLPFCLCFFLSDLSALCGEKLLVFLSGRSTDWIRSFY